MMVMMMITFMSFVVVVMTMTYEWLGDNSNDDSDYHDTTSTLRTMKIKM